MEQTAVPTVLPWVIFYTALVLGEPFENITENTCFKEIGATWYDKDVICDLVEKISEEIYGCEICLSESGRGISTETVGRLARYTEDILDGKRAAQA